MSKRKLTQLALNNLSEGTYWDTHLPAFGVKVGKTRRSSIVNKNKSRTVLGHHPIMSLADARTKAREILYGVQQTPIAIVKDAIERYLTIRQAELSKGAWTEYKRHLERCSPN